MQIKTDISMSAHDVWHKLKENVVSLSRREKEGQHVEIPIHDHRTKEVRTA
jgi:hypothetical protein